MAGLCGVKGESTVPCGAPVLSDPDSACPLVYIIVDTIEFIVLHCSVLLAAQLLFLIVLYKQILSLD